MENTVIEAESLKINAVSKILASNTSEIVNPEILSVILKPYKATQTDYLKQASVNAPLLTESDEPVSTTGTFTIPNSCYIDSTGHFNAVEFLICYNQLSYTIFGFLSYHNRLDRLRVVNRNSNAEAEMERLSFDHFLIKQLSSTFILKSELSFRGIIAPEFFEGSVTIEKITYRAGTFFIKTQCVFQDHLGGSARGSVLLAYMVN